MTRKRLTQADALTLIFGASLFVSPVLAAGVMLGAWAVLNWEHP